MAESEDTFDDYDKNTELRIQSLDTRHKECMKDCGIIARQMKELTDFNTKKTVEGVTLPINATLVDLLIQRILTDPSDKWKSNVDLLINIPHGIDGVDFLRGGDYFEALFQLAAATGYLPGFKGKEIVFSDISDYKTMIPMKDYLYTKTVKNSGGKEQGVSDITFTISGSGKSYSSYKCGEIPTPESALTDDPTYFISVKGYKKEKNAAKEYDIPIIHHQMSIFPEVKNKHIIVCVRNKEEFEKRLGRSRMGFIRSSVNVVIGYGEVMDAIDEFRKDFFVGIGSDLITPETIRQHVEKRFPKQKALKPMLSLYFHQELVATSVINRIHEIGEPTKPHFMCIGVLPRGGKSFIAGGIIREHMKRKPEGGYNVLFITSAVNETREQFREDLINKFSDFDSFDFLDIVNDKTKSGKQPNKFMFASRQLVTLSGGKAGAENDEVETTITSGDIYSKIKEALGSEPSFDICFFDEAHIGIGSEKVREQFQTTFDKFKIPIVMMTATYKNPATALDSKKDLFIWDLQDVKDMKDLPTLKFSGFIEKQPELFAPSRYGELAKSIMSKRISYGETEERIARPYIYFPVPNFISLTFKPEVLKHFEETKDGYAFKKAFVLNKERSSIKDKSQYATWGKLLTNREDAIRIRQFLTPEVDQETGEDKKEEILINKDRKFRALNQVFRIAQKNGSRPVAGTPFSMLMFLPVKEDGMPIGELCRIWGSFMLESKYWRDNFVFLTLSVYNPPRPKKGEPKITITKDEPTTKEDWEKAIQRGLFHREDFRTSLKETIQMVERKALEHGKGLVLLSGDVAKMGISLKCVDVVCMMNTNKDADDIIQKMYRALTDDPPTKKNGFIIDLDIKRIVTAMFQYDIERKPLQRVGDETEVKERLDSIMDLCNWGQDAYMEDTHGMTFDDVMNDVRKLVFGDLSKTLHVEELKKVGDKVVGKQVDFIWKNEGAKQAVYAALRNTSAVRDPLPARDVRTIMERGEAVLGVSSSAEPPPPAQEPQAAEEPENPLTEKEVKEKFSNIIQTFINSLVIKSSESWDANISFETLISKYKADKLTATRKCSCDTGTECIGKSANMYDLVYCELRGYAFTKKGEYSGKMHESIMRILDEIFQSPETVVPEWSAYVNAMITELKTKSVGGRRRSRTWKKRNHNVKNGGRTKRANHSRYYRKKTSPR